MLTSALAYPDRLGYAVLPLHTPTPGGRTACSCLNPKCDSVGKHPRCMHGVKDATTDPEKIRRWWEMWPTANIGIACGEPSGVLVLDIDGPNADQWLLARCELPATPTSLTGKGRHLYFAAPDFTVKNTVRIAPDLDIRATGTLVAVPPSLHYSGCRYAWDRAHGLGPRDVTPAALPAALVDLLRQHRPPRGVGIGSDETIPNTMRNDTLTRFAGAMRRVAMSEGAILAALQAENEKRCEPPLDDDEVRRIAAGILRYDPAPAGGADRRSAQAKWDAAFTRACPGADA